MVPLDNREDPFQQHNLIDDPGSAKLAHDLDGVALDWMKKAGDSFPYEELRKKRSVFT
jgi:hypothetical protein